MSAEASRQDERQVCDKLTLEAAHVRNWREQMKREGIRVEPLSTCTERWKAPTSAVTRHGDTIYVSGLPPFDPETGEIVDACSAHETSLRANGSAHSAARLTGSAKQSSFFRQ